MSNNVPPVISVSLAVIISAVIFTSLGYQLAQKVSPALTPSLTTSPVVTLTPVSTPTVSPNPTPAGKQSHYQSTQGDISFDLPAGYSVLKTGDCEGTCTITFKVVKQESTNFLSDANITIMAQQGKWTSLAEWSNNLGVLTKDQNSTDTTIGTMKAIRFKELGMADVTGYRFIGSNYGYTISVTEGADVSLVNTLLKSLTVK